MLSKGSKINKTLIKYCSIAVLSLGFFIGSSIVPSPCMLKPAVSYDTTESRWEYGTHGWDFTMEEMKEVYEKEYKKGRRLESFIRIEDGKYIASYDGRSFEVPKGFIQHTLSHLEQMLEEGYAAYIFRLDAFHNHFFVPDENFDKYKTLKGVEAAVELTHDKSLGALYHNSEHLALRNPPEEGEIDPIAEELRSKRNVLGWYDGRPLELTYPKDNVPVAIKEANTADIPKGYHNVGPSLTFKATKNGEFSIRPYGKEIKVDISFDADCYY